MDKIKWQCPRCLDRFEAGSEPTMFWLQRHHIQDHESKAACQAVDQAKMSCVHFNCKLGLPKVVDGMPLFTDFDKGFLRTLKVSWEDPHGNQL